MITTITHISTIPGAQGGVRRAVVFKAGALPGQHCDAAVQCGSWFYQNSVTCRTLAPGSQWHSQMHEYGFKQSLKGIRTLVENCSFQRCVIHEEAV